jgi:hypothetical protein
MYELERHCEELGDVMTESQQFSTRTIQTLGTLWDCLLETLGALPAPEMCFAPITQFCDVFVVWMAAIARRGLVDEGIEREVQVSLGSLAIIWSNTLKQYCDWTVTFIKGVAAVGFDGRKSMEAALETRHDDMQIIATKLIQLNILPNTCIDGLMRVHQMALVSLRGKPDTAAIAQNHSCVAIHGIRQLSHVRGNQFRMFMSKQFGTVVGVTVNGTAKTGLIVLVLFATDNAAALAVRASQNVYWKNYRLVISSI